MKISTILDQVDSGHIALPEFQRGYVWSREQVRGLFDSLYRRRPVGGLLVWETEANVAPQRGESPLAAGDVKLLLDGQQRVTSLYGVVRGKPPLFFDGNAQAFTGLRFHLETELFEFYQPVKMKDDPLWMDVTDLMRRGNAGLGEVVARLSSDPAIAAKIGEYIGKLSSLLGILDIAFHIETIERKEKSLDVVVEIFNRVNSAGTTLSKGDLALAKICSEWPSARERMKTKITQWNDAGFHFELDWLLRSVNTVVTGEAKFSYLHGRTPEEIQSGLSRASKHIDTCLNLIGGRLGLDHDQVFFGRYGIPVMVRYLDKKDQKKEGLDGIERDKLLFWYVQAAMWGRFSGSTESAIDQELAVLEGEDGGLDRLLERLRLWHGGFRAEPAHFDSWSLGARFYPVLYMLTRMGDAVDWGTGLPLKASLLGKMSKLEVHHIFPKAQLYKRHVDKAEVNALANFAFQTKDTNLDIGSKLPDEYFPLIEQAHPGALASQWIPMDARLWKVENLREFLAARKELLAAELNQRMHQLVHGDTRWFEGPQVQRATVSIPGGISDENEEREIGVLNAWMQSQGLPLGHVSFGYTEPETGEQKAVFDLAWPSGVQTGLSQPVAVLLSEPAEVLAIASQAGFRCFTQVDQFRRYVSSEILGLA